MNYSDKKLIIISSTTEWSFNGVGGSDSYNRRLIDGLKGVGVNVETLFLKSGIKNIFYEIPNLLRLIYIKKDDYIVIYRCDLSQRLILTLITFFGNIGNHKIIVPFSFGFGIKSAIKYFTFRFVSKRKNIIVLSESQKRYICKNFNYTPNVLLPAIPKLFLNHKTKKLKSNSTTIVTFVGRIDIRKGFSLVLELFKKLSTEIDIECRIYAITINDDPGVNELVKELNNFDNIKTCFINRSKYTADLDNQLMSWLDDCDYFIQPYLNIESTVDTPLLLLEAISRGCTILSTKHDQVLDVIGDKSCFEIDEFVDRSLYLISRRQFFKYNESILYSPVDQAKKLLDLF